VFHIACDGKRNIPALSPNKPFVPLFPDKSRRADGHKKLTS